MQVTLEGITELLKLELDPMKADLKDIKETQRSHSTSLDTLMTEKKNRDEAKIVSTNRVDRLEKWAKEVSQKVGVKLEL